MTRNEANKKETELIKLLEKQYPDIVAHIDIIDGTDEIAISFFWNRISVQRWNDAQTFKGKARDYQMIIETEILPFFNKN